MLRIKRALTGLLRRVTLRAWIADIVAAAAVWMLAQAFGIRRDARKLRAFTTTDELIRRLAESPAAAGLDRDRCIAILTEEGVAVDAAWTLWTTGAARACWAMAALASVPEVDRLAKLRATTRIWLRERPEFRRQI